MKLIKVNIKYFLNLISTFFEEHTPPRCMDFYTPYTPYKQMQMVCDSRSIAFCPVSRINL